MAGDPFVFLRATAGLGHRAVDLAALPRVPVGWICGDLHLQNFGSFRGVNRLVYFDLNDFDEAARLPVCLDLLRLMGSLITAAPGIGLDRQAALTLARRCLRAYGQALARGKAFWLERETASGPVRALLRQTEGRKRKDLLAARTRVSAGVRQIAVDGQRYLAVGPRAAVRRHIAAALEHLGARHADPRFFEARDIAFRVAGMGSLGLQRYVALVCGKGDPGRNALVDFKQAAPSAAAGAFPGILQPQWSDEAQRVAAIQDMCQAASPAYLCAMTLGKMPVIVRELQPVEDKMALAPLARHVEQLDETLEAMGRLAAYAQLRSAGRHGAAGADELIDYGRRLLTRQAPWIDAARAVAAANERAFEIFRGAWHGRDARLTGLAEGAESPAPPAGASAKPQSPGKAHSRPAVRAAQVQSAR
jgi:uncharacterized protein (DUF2252 family)